jgi:hypothetical protein
VHAQQLPEVMRFQALEKGNDVLPLTDQVGKVVKIVIIITLRDL